MTYKTPGVYIEDRYLPPAVKMQTGVPVFLGLTERVPAKSSDSEFFPIFSWDEFTQKFGKIVPDSYLAKAVHGFFENGGTLCYVNHILDTNPEELKKTLSALEHLDDIDLICAPDLMMDPQNATDLQKLILDHCDRAGNRFSILDSLPGADLDKVVTQCNQLKSINAALYYPWVQMQADRLGGGLAPPCGHIAGVYARTDRQIGVHKAPANEIVEGVVDLEVNLTNRNQGNLNNLGINCLRILPGRGLRVWGARTLAGKDNSEWIYCNVRRLFITVGRWIAKNMSHTVFEPNNQTLWEQIKRGLNSYLNELFLKGAIKGKTPEEAFFIRCDAQTNRREVREAGMVIVDIGLAPIAPGEYIVVRIRQSTTDTTMSIR